MSKEFMKAQNGQFLTPLETESEGLIQFIKYESSEGKEGAAPLVLLSPSLSYVENLHMNV